MKKRVRPIRAAMAMGLTWGTIWFAAGVLIARVPGFYSDLPFALQFAPLGIATGIIFSGLLVVTEGLVVGLAERVTPPWVSQPNPRRSRARAAAIRAGQDSSVAVRDQAACIAGEQMCEGGEQVRDD
jgi:hypothetical protein